MCPSGLIRLLSKFQSVPFAFCLLFFLFPVICMERWAVQCASAAWEREHSILVIIMTVKLHTTWPRDLKLFPSPERVMLLLSLGQESLSVWWTPPSPAGPTPNTHPPPREDFPWPLNKVKISSFKLPQWVVSPFSVATVNYCNEFHAGRDVSLNSASSGILMKFCWIDK